MLVTNIKFLQTTINIVNSSILKKGTSACEKHNIIYITLSKNDIHTLIKNPKTNVARTMIENAPYCLRMYTFSLE